MNIQLKGIIATENTVSTSIGLLKEVIVEGANDKIETLISEGVKRGVPFERIGDKVKFNFWK